MSRVELTIDRHHTWCKGRCTGRADYDFVVAGRDYRIGYPLCNWEGGPHQLELGDHLCHALLEASGHECMTEKEAILVVTNRYWHELGSPSPVEGLEIVIVGCVGYRRYIDLTATLSRLPPAHTCSVCSRESDSGFSYCDYGRFGNGFCQPICMSCDLVLGPKALADRIERERERISSGIECAECGKRGTPATYAELWGAKSWICSAACREARRVRIRNEWRVRRRREAAMEDLRKVLVLENI